MPEMAHGKENSRQPSQPASTFRADFESFSIFNLSLISITMSDSEAQFRDTLDTVQVCCFPHILLRFALSDPLRLFLQEYLELQVQLQQVLKKGYMDLASARYVAGPQRISHLLVPTTMTAAKRVVIGKEE